MLSASLALCGSTFRGLGLNAAESSRPTALPASGVSSLSVLEELVHQAALAGRQELLVAADDAERRLADLPGLSGARQASSGAPTRGRRHRNGRVFVCVSAAQAL